jgi:hypothetical protein
MKPIFRPLVLSRDQSGVAMTEFAIALPFLLTAGLWGAELANFTHANMRVGQIAMQIADNGSRVGDTSTLQDRKIFESDINDLIYGAHLHGGKAFNLYDNGRVIISSLQVDAKSGDQYIDWQRCRGALKRNSAYGNAGKKLGSTGIGPVGNEVQAQPGDAVIFVEVFYSYRPLVTQKFVGNTEIRTHAAFTVRDDRDISQIYQRDPKSPDPVHGCNAYTGTPTLSGDTVV